MKLTALELCAGGGGQALGLDMAGFECVAAVEVDAYCCSTLRLNRPSWNVLQKDIREIEPSQFKGVDLVAAGVPAPPSLLPANNLAATMIATCFRQRSALSNKQGPPRGLARERARIRRWKV
jgi:hypothetical protein